MIKRFAALCIFALLLAACVTPQPDPPPSARNDTQADALFHQDPLWLGGDGAMSIPLGPDRVLWLFGDSFIAHREGETRKAAAFARNSVAVETGADPRTAQMDFAWRASPRGPASFFPESGKTWYWPGHGIRFDDGTLAIFLSRIAATPGKGLGFKAVGYAVALIANPDASPDDWRPRIIDAPVLPFDALPGSAVLRDGEHLVVLAVRQAGTHAGTFVRFRMTDIARGDLGRAEWLGPQMRWRTASAIARTGPAFVIDDAGAEASIHWSETQRAFVHTASRGFGATTIATRTAPALAGPWSAPRTQFTPPESHGANPFVYAAKAHPELAADGDVLLVTYIASSLTPDDLLTPQGQANLYWPRFVAIPTAALRD